MTATQPTLPLDKPGNQKERILKYLDDFGSITPLDAIRDIGVMALSQRIGDLKRSGHNIVTETETARNRYGQETRYARYRVTNG